jgi:hypothetical protein
LPPDTDKRLPSTIAPNVLDRDFRALAPNRRLHLHLDRRGLALLMMAIWRWGKPDALPHHSDQRSQAGLKWEPFQCQSASKWVLIDIIGIGRDPRSHGQGVFVFDPLHYLVLIETKPNALDQAAPFFCVLHPPGRPE